MTVRGIDPDTVQIAVVPPMMAVISINQQLTMQVSDGDLSAGLK